jgi:hypothetical protein
VSDLIFHSFDEYLSYTYPEKVKKEKYKNMSPEELIEQVIMDMWCYEASKLKFALIKERSNTRNG